MEKEQTTYILKNKIKRKNKIGEKAMINEECFTPQDMASRHSITPYLGGTMSHAVFIVFLNFILSSV